MVRIRAPFVKEDLSGLRAGSSVLLSGEIYTARDAAHKRLVAMLKTGSQMPFKTEGSAIYYAGPAPAKPGAPIGPCGPTSAVRMDSYAPVMFDSGVLCTIAKGPVSEEVKAAIKRNCAVYLCAAGGCGALLSKCVLSAEPVAFLDLGTEAVLRLTVEDMPLIVGIDPQGNSLFI